MKLRSSGIMLIMMTLLWIPASYVRGMAMAQFDLMRNKYMVSSYGATMGGYCYAGLESKFIIK